MIMVMKDRGCVVGCVVGSCSSGSSNGDIDGGCPAPRLQYHTFEERVDKVVDHAPVEAAPATTMETVWSLGFKTTI